MFFILLLLFTSLPLIEIYFLLKVGGEIGAMNTFAIVIVTGFVGAWFAKREGRAVLVDLNGAIAGGKEPTDLILSGVLVFAGGLLLLTPGFVTDILGLSFVLPGSRHFYIGLMKSYFKKAIQSGSVRTYGSTTIFTNSRRESGPGFGGRNSETFRRPNQPDNVIDIEATRLDKDD